MSDISVAWRGWVKWYEIARAPWTIGSNLNWIVLASLPDRIKFMIISQGQTHTCLCLKQRQFAKRHLCNTKRHEKAKRHRENRRGGRHEVHSLSPIAYAEGTQSPLITGVSATRMPGRQKLLEGVVNKQCTAFHHLPQSRFLHVPGCFLFIPSQTASF